MFWLFECFIQLEPLLWGHNVLSCFKETVVFLRVWSVNHLSPEALAKNTDSRAPFPTTCIGTQQWDLRRIVFRQAPQAILSVLLWRTTEVRGGERNRGLCSFTAELRANIVFSLPATLTNMQWFFILRMYYLTFFSPKLLVYQQLQTKPRLLPVALGTLVGSSYKIIFRSWSSHENPHLWVCLLKRFAFPDCGFCDILSQTIVLLITWGKQKLLE